jgi:hypothetical protein
MRSEPGHQSPHLIRANMGSVRPFVEVYSPEFSWSAGVPRRQHDMKVGQPVTQDEAVDVLGPSHLLQRSRQTVHQETQGSCLSIGEIAQACGMSLGFGDKVATVSRQLFGRPVGVSGINQVIVEENASGGVMAQRMFLADEAILNRHLENRRVDGVVG